MLDFLSWLILGRKRREYHGKCPDCEETVRHYSKPLSDEQAKTFWKDARLATQNHCSKKVRKSSDG